MLKKLIELKINGDVHEVAIDPRRTLVEVLREDLDLTGTKESCGDGDCGACTVLMDGKPVNGCLVLALEAQGKDIVTIEGIAKNGKLHPVQQAFIDHFAIQCGFCTPGMIISSVALLGRNPHPTEDEVRKAIAGNLCRCTGYVKIVEAILATAQAS